MSHYSHIDQSELQSTQSDIEAFAEIGLYYAAKIRAAFALAQYDLSEDTVQKELSLAWLAKAEQHWNKYADIYSQKNMPALYNRVGYVDVNKLKENVKKDTEIVINWKTKSISYKPINTTEKVFRK